MEATDEARPAAFVFARGCGPAVGLRCRSGARLVLLASIPVSLTFISSGGATRGDEGLFSVSKYWFPAKRYGWGWGLPTTWQGWIAVLAFVVLIAAGSILLPPGRSLAAYLIYVCALVVLLLGLCWLKGEPPRWRWGGRDRA
ncbi:MAG TPA: hypothetical protein VME92_09115 [Acetobacteraceae bacterium]|nr:hypothetical protein [Acetobacteraceae bacterium]